MNKKSLSLQLLAFFIIMLIIAVLLLMWIYVWKGTTEQLTRKEQCKNSVKNAALTQLKQYQVVPGVIECPILEKTIKGDPSNTRQADAIKREIANLMAEAWDVYGKGELNLFESSGTYCAVYSVVDFEKKGIIEDFENYLATTHTPFIGQDYLAYLTNEDVTKSQQYLSYKQNKNIVIDTSKKYAVVFVYIREAGRINDEISRLGSAITSLGGATGPQSGEQVVGTIGAGVMGFGAGALGVALLGGGPVTVVLGGATVASVTVYSAVFDGEQPQWASMVILTPYENENSLKELGCQYLPVELGTR